MRESAKHLARGRTGFRTLVIKPEIHARGEINVTPLIDVVLVLLIIFMVVTPLAERELAVLLPDSKRVEPARVSPSQLAVRIDDAGTVAINEREVQRAAYVAELRALLEGREPRQRVVFVMASDAVPYPRLVEIMDGAKQAGATTVGLAIEGEP